MSAPVETSIQLDGHAIRVWRKGSGRPIGFFAGWGGLPRWTPFLEQLAQTRTVIAPSLPGFPGGGRAQLDLDTHLDWVVAARKIYMAAGLEGADLVGVSVGGALAAEIAALWPNAVRNLVLVAPFGLFVDDDPPTDVFAQRVDEYPALLCANPERYRNHEMAPEGMNSVEWDISRARANEAAARMLWPLGNTRLERRLPLITQPTLIVWGQEDRVMPHAYAERMAAAIKGRTRIARISGAGHLVDLDQPETLASAVCEWTGE